MKTKLKRNYFNLLKTTGFSDFIRWYKKGEINIVLYHGIINNNSYHGTKSLSGMIKREVFIKHLNYYKKYYDVISFNRFVTAIQNKNSIQKGLLITFDDGYRSTFTEVLPLLREFDFSAAVFITSSGINNENILWPNLFSLTIEQKGKSYLVRKLKELGFTINKHLESSALIYNVASFCSPNIIENCSKDIADYNNWNINDLSKELSLYADIDMILSAKKQGFTIGSHTVNHKNLALLKEDKQRYEMFEAHKAISKITDVPFEEIPFAFPFGGYNRHFTDLTISICQSLGIKYLFAADGGSNKIDQRHTYYRRKYIPIYTNKSFELDSVMLRG